MTVTDDLAELTLDDKTLLKSLSPQSIELDRLVMREP